MNKPREILASLGGISPVRDPAEEQEEFTCDKQKKPANYLAGSCWGKFVGHDYQRFLPIGHGLKTTGYRLIVLC